MCVFWGRDTYVFSLTDPQLPWGGENCIFKSLDVFFLDKYGSLDEVLKTV